MKMNDESPGRHILLGSMLSALIPIMNKPYWIKR